MRPLLFTLSLALLAGNAHAKTPRTIPHQGRIAVNGVNFEGTGHFKFVLFSDIDAIHDNGNEVTQWASAPFTEFSTVTEPATSIAIPVTKGLYHVRLGDDTAGNPAFMPPLPEFITPAPGLFDLSDSVRRSYLRIWFSDGVSGFQALSPDQSMDSVPFSIHAAVADSVLPEGVTGVANNSITGSSVIDGSLTGFDLADESITGGKLQQGTVTSTALADGSVTTSKLADSSITQAQIAPGAVTQIAQPGDPSRTVMAVGTDGLISAGFGSPLSASFGSATLVHRTHTSEGLVQPTHLRVRDGILYVADQSTKKLNTFEFRNASSLVPLGNIQTNADTIRSFDVENRFAYVGSNFVGDQSRLHAFGVQNPAQMTTHGFLNLTGDMKAIDAIDGNILVAQSFNNGFDIGGSLTQISEPTMPLGSSLLQMRHIRSTFDDPSNDFLSAMKAVSVEGKRAYVIEGNALSIYEFDAPGTSDFLFLNNEAIVFANPVDVQVQDNLAYVLDAGSDQIHVVDVSNPNSVVLLGSGGSGLVVPTTMRVVGRFAYILDAATASLHVFDVSDPSSILSLTKSNVGMTSPSDLDVEGNFAFVADAESGAVHVFQVAPTVSIAGGLAATGDSTFDSVRVMKEISFRDGSTLSAYPDEFLRDDGSEPLKGDLTVQGRATASDYRLATPKTYTVSIPGTSLLPQNPSENLFRSELGYIQQASGTDLAFGGVAALNLPDGALITGIDTLYHDNSPAANFSNLRIRVRRVQTTSIPVSEQNILATDILSPPTGNSDAMIVSTNNTPDLSRAVVNNALYTYFVSLTYTITATDTNLRVYGFRIRYTISSLTP